MRLTATLAIACGLAATGAFAEPLQKDTEAQRLVRFTFEPIDQVAAAKREVRRVSFADIYNDRTLPGVVLEKKAGGEVTVTIISDYGKTIDAATLKPEAWAYVTRKDAVALAPAPRIAPASVEICHGASAVIESASSGIVRRREAGVCGGKADEAAMEYARAIAEVAVTSIPRCAGFIESGREFSWSLRECLNRTARKLSPNPYATATGDNNENFRSFALTTASVKRAPASTEDLF